MTETLEKFEHGVRRFIVGLGKKVLLGNNIGMLRDAVKDIPEPPALTVWLGLAAFTFQIYFDFSGYSDMAAGLGLMFSFPALITSIIPTLLRAFLSYGAGGIYH